MDSVPCADVLVVDDDFDTVKAVAAILEAAGHRCTTAASGREALELCMAQPLDCMVLDITLADTTGIAVAKVLAQMPRVRPRHVVLLADQPRAEYLSELRNGLVDAFVRKPAEIPKLVESILLALSRAQLRRDPALTRTNASEWRPARRRRARRKW